MSEIITENPYGYFLCLQRFKYFSRLFWRINASNNDVDPWTESEIYNLNQSSFTI